MPELRGKMKRPDFLVSENIRKDSDQLRDSPFLRDTRQVGDSEKEMTDVKADESFTKWVLHSPQLRNPWEDLSPSG